MLLFCSVSCKWHVTTLRTKHNVPWVTYRTRGDMAPSASLDPFPQALPPLPPLQPHQPSRSWITHGASISPYPHSSLLTCCSPPPHPEPASPSPPPPCPPPFSLSFSLILLPFLSLRIHNCLEEMVALFRLWNKQRNKNCWLPFSLHPKDLIWLNSQTIMKTGRYLSFVVISLKLKELEHRTRIWLNAPLC